MALELKRSRPVTRETSKYLGRAERGALSVSSHYSLLLVHGRWILSRIVLQMGAAMCITYTRRGVRGVRRQWRCRHHTQTHVDGFAGVECGVAGVIFGRTSALSRASKTASSAPNLDVCRRLYGRRQVILLASHSDVCCQCYLLLSLATYNLQLVFLASVLFESRPLPNLSFDQRASLSVGSRVFLTRLEGVPYLPLLTFFRVSCLLMLA